MSDSLSRADLERLQAAGWGFPQSGTRVANGWAVLATTPDKKFSLQIISDPEDEPEKWAEPDAKPDQPDLFDYVNNSTNNP